MIARPERMAAGDADLDAEVLRLVRREQQNMLALANRLFVPTGISTVLLVAADFRNHFPRVAGPVTALILLGYVLLATATGRRARGRADRTFERRSIAIIAALGVLWGILVNVLLTSCATSSQRGLLGALAVGLVSAPLIASPVAAAGAFWLLSALSGVALILRTSPFDPYTLLCFLGYLAFTFATISLWNRSTLERSIGRIVQERQNETINVFLRSYEEGGADWLWETDADGMLHATSRRFEEVAALGGEVVRGRRLAELFPAQDGTAPEIQRMLAARTSFRDLEVRVGHGTQARCWNLTGTPVIEADGSFRGYRGVGRDITEIRQAEQKVRHLAHHDSLTGLANRAAFMGALDQVCAAALTASHTAALLLLDLDRFKIVNDTLGHPAGDELLRIVAKRLRETVRGEPMIARLGGDEFGLICAVADENEAEAIGRRLMARIAAPYQLGGARQLIGASVGIVLIGHEPLPPAVLFGHADLALYAAKQRGRGECQVFRPELIGEHQKKLELQRDLELAIRGGELELVFQPIYDVRSGAIATVEALCRWHHKLLGNIPPATFIPLAEESGLIIDLGEWALTEACRVARDWPPGIQVAVNVSPTQIKSADFLRHVEELIERSGLSPHRLDLEVTEQAYLDAADEVLDCLRRLREVGCHLTLDDFGVGYSSLSYLATFPFDAIKLDAGFMQGVAHDARKASIVRVVVQLAGELDLEVTAEGIESDEQQRMLATFGIRYAQGFGLSRPVIEAELGDLLARQALGSPISA